MIDIIAIFMAWLDRSELPVGIVIANSKPKHVVFGIEGWKCLHGSLSDSGINIYAVRSEECWDIIWDSDISPTEFEGGWGCCLCIDAWEKGLYQKPESYGSLEALWVEHTLVPFSNWLEKLATSTGIAFIDYDGATEARLLQEGEQVPKKAVKVIGRMLPIEELDA